MENFEIPKERNNKEDKMQHSINQTFEELSQDKQAELLAQAQTKLASEGLSAKAIEGKKIEEAKNILYDKQRKKDEEKADKEKAKKKKEELEEIQDDIALLEKKIGIMELNLSEVDEDGKEKMKKMNEEVNALTQKALKLENELRSV